MPENNTNTRKQWVPIIAIILSLCAIIAVMFIYVGMSDSRAPAANAEQFRFTIGDTDSIPRCVTIKGPDNTFITVQADNEIEIKPNGMCTITETIKDPGYFSYVVKSDKILVFQTVSGETLNKMQNQYGPANVTCTSPDGKIIEGRADKIYIHDNGMCEFVLSNTWYCTDLTNMSIEST